MDVIEEVCENSFGVFLFCNRTPVEMFVLCFHGGFHHLGALLDISQMLVSFEGSFFFFLHISRQSQFSSDSPSCRPAFFFLNRSDLSSSSVTDNSLVSILLCVLADSRSRGTIAFQFSHSVSVSAATLFQDSSGSQPRIAPFLFVYLFFGLNERKASTAL